MSHGMTVMPDKKIYISADMEGITGVIHWDETSGNHPDYQYFRQIMTNEVNAAIEGALEQGATEIVVRDAHSSARNLIPDKLHESALLIREWSKGPFAMMEAWIRVLALSAVSATMPKQ